jgi:hypothetical protein
MVLFSLPLLCLTFSACGPSRSEIAQQGRDREPRASSQTTDDKTNEDNVTRARRLDVVSMATVPVAPLTSRESLDDYSSRLADLQFLIASADRHHPTTSISVAITVTPSLNLPKRVWPLE